MQRLTRPLSSRSSNSSLASRFGAKIVDDFVGEGLGRGRTGRVPICSAWSKRSPGSRPQAS